MWKCLCEDPGCVERSRDVGKQLADEAEAREKEMAEAEEPEHGLVDSDNENEEPEAKEDVPDEYVDGDEVVFE